MADKKALRIMRINEFITKITGTKVTGIAKAADMLCVSVENDFAIDIQAAFRVEYNGKIVLSTSDMYSEKVDNLINDAEKLLQPFPEIVDIKIGSYNDLTVTLNNGVVIRTFSDTSENNEQWRMFIKHNSAPHYVAYLYGIDEE